MASTTELSQSPTTPPSTTQSQSQSQSQSQTTEAPTSTSHSPNSSPSRRRKRHDRTDSFLALANAPIPSRDPSPHTSPSSDDVVDHSQDSLVQWAIIGPLSFISFILSLALVDHRERSRRLNEHPSRDHSVFRTLTGWIDPVPYASSRAHTDPNAVGAKAEGKEEGTNYIMKKHRKMAALSANDAFAMRGRVMVGVVAVFLLGVLGVTWAARRASEFVFSRVWT